LLSTGSKLINKEEERLHGGDLGGGAQTSGGRAREGDYRAAGDGAADSNTLLNGKYKY
jgi:hypothetical protein